MDTNNFDDEVQDASNFHGDEFYTPGKTPRDMPDLESEESAEQRRNQEREGLKILTLDQMFSRLPIPLVQLKAGNNSEKCKHEIR